MVKIGVDLCGEMVYNILARRKMANAVEDERRNATMYHPNCKCSMDGSKQEAVEVIQDIAVTTRTSFEGIHCWPDAPDEVWFLRYPHRHVFGVEVKLWVDHGDRDVEFIMFKRAVNRAISSNASVRNGVWDMGSLSCEQVAGKIYDALVRDQGAVVDRMRTVQITVDEDGENGATVMFCPVTHGESVGSGRGEFGDMDAYQKLAYVAVQKHESDKDAIMHWAVGLGEESGELMGVFKHRYFGGGYDVQDAVEEIGDVLWHIAAICTTMGIDMSDVAKYNLAKLRYRYPDGVFDAERSLGRKSVGKKFRATVECNAMMEKIAKKIDERHEKCGAVEGRMYDA